MDLPSACRNEQQRSNLLNVPSSAWALQVGPAYMLRVRTLGTKNEAGPGATAGSAKITKLVKHAGS
jgi:hypothetical protein